MRPAHVTKVLLLKMHSNSPFMVCAMMSKTKKDRYEIILVICFYVVGVFFLPSTAFSVPSTGWTHALAHAHTHGRFARISECPKLLQKLTFNANFSHPFERINYRVRPRPCLLLRRISEGWEGTCEEKIAHLRVDVGSGPVE